MKNTAKTLISGACASLVAVTALLAVAPVQAAPTARSNEASIKRNTKIAMQNRTRLMQNRKIAMQNRTRLMQNRKMIMQNREMIKAHHHPAPMYGTR